MAKAASRATTLTTLVVGKVEMAVGLFASRDKPGGLVKFDTAGPHGGVLEARPIARPVPVAETVEIPDAPVHSDPLEQDPGPELVRDDTLSMSETYGVNTSVAASTVAGEYGRELVEKGSGDVVLPQDVRRGVRLEDGRFIDCTEQIAAIEERTKLDRMDVVAFIDSTRVARALIANAYYLGAADEKAPKPMRLIYEALKARRRVALVKVTKKARQSLGVITAYGQTLMLLECVWAEDHRPPPPKALALQKATVSESEVARACELVDAMAGGILTMDQMRDDAIALREELYAKALAGEVPQVVVPPKVADDLDLEAALEASLAMVSG